MELDIVMAELEAKGNEQTKKVLKNHGAKEPFFGVKVQDLKVILKGRKNNQELAEQLYATGNTDAMYLAGLMADKNSISKETIERWADEAYWYYLNEYAVPWIAAESPYGLELATKWIEDPRPQIQATGWATFSSILGIQTEHELSDKQVILLMERVEREIHEQSPRVRFVMNGFVIAAGASSESLTEIAKTFGKRIGKVEVPMPNNIRCNVPDIPTYIKKVEDRGSIGRKKKTARC